MAARLAVAERNLLTAKREIIEKDGKIRELEKRLSLLVAPPPSPSTHQLEVKCSALQRQVEEMEVVLSSLGHSVNYSLSCFRSSSETMGWCG